jgi:hypothetical protein
MLKRHRWQLLLALGLVLGSALLYWIHYLLFRDVHHIFLYMVGDLAFVPIEVLVVTLILHRLLERRDRRQRLEKMNMVIGSFFSEVGTRLLAFVSDHDPNLETIRSTLIVEGDWTDKEFRSVAERLRTYRYRAHLERADFPGFKEFLVPRREFMLRLLENPVLLEHESFTSLLRAAFHLVEELESRSGFKDLPDTDITHLNVDANRVYVHLVREWLEYMQYLKPSYPYLFSLAVRTNPFKQDSSAVVSG